MSPEKVQRLKPGISRVRRIDGTNAKYSDGTVMRVENERVIEIHLDEHSSPNEVLQTDAKLWRTLPIITTDDIAEVLKELHYEITSNDGRCLVAWSTHVWDKVRDKPISINGKRKVALKIDEKDDVIYFGIREDADTRYVFNGVIDTLDDIRWIDEHTKIM